MSQVKTLELENLFTKLQDIGAKMPDELQSSLVKMIEAENQPDNPLAYARTAIKNASIDERRRAKRHPQIDIDSLPIKDQTPSPEEIIITKEQRQSLLRGISDLTNPQQKVIMLRFGHDMRFAEIAREMNQSENSVKKIARRAYDKLKAYCEEEGLFPSAKKAS